MCEGGYESVDGVKFFLLSLCVMCESEGLIDKCRRFFLSLYLRVD